MGELDYSGKFYPSSSGYADQVSLSSEVIHYIKNIFQNYTKVASYVLYLTFSIVMTILIMNLLVSSSFNYLQFQMLIFQVGLAVGDIMEIQKEATIQRIGMQVSMETVSPLQLIFDFVTRLILHLTSSFFSLLGFEDVSREKKK